MKTLTRRCGTRRPPSMLWRAGRLIFVLKHRAEVPHTARHLERIAPGPVDAWCLWRNPRSLRSNSEDIDCQGEVPGFVLDVPWK